MPSPGVLEGSSSSHAAIATGWCSPVRGSHTGPVPGGSFSVCVREHGCCRSGPDRLCAPKQSEVFHCLFHLQVQCCGFYCGAFTTWPHRNGHGLATVLAPTRACLLSTTEPTRPLQLLLHTQPALRVDLLHPPPKSVSDGKPIGSGVCTI